ncbi:cadherin-like beta sandwich domain-containing protein [Clostridium saccharoperbutylacetonicum]
MNKNIKRMISMTLVLGVLSAVAPVTNFNFMSIKAYANSTDGVTKLKVKSSGGNSMTLYSDSECEHSVNSSDDPGTYYVKTSSDSVEIDMDGPNEDYVRVFDDTSSSAKGKRIGAAIGLSDSKTIVVRVYSENPGSVKYNDKTNVISEYRVRVKYTGTVDEEKDNVYLKDITVSSGEISFSKKTYTYNVNVAENIDKITIGARPDADTSDYDNYKVRIDGTKVTNDDKYKEEVSLVKGKNEIQIDIEDDEDNSRTYTLNVFRGNDATSNNSNNNQAVNNTNLDADGNKATDLKKVDGLWYYFGQDGVKKIGWQKINGSLYHFDNQGIMQIGWMRDIDGKYYYLNSNGVMASNTTIGEYKLGADGARIE